jgi:hypothetical protein
VLRDPEQAKTVIQALPAKERRQVVYEAMKVMEPEELTEVGEAVTQFHPATAKKPPLGLPKHDYGFDWEMSGVHTKLMVAIRNYVEAWEEKAPNATEEELQLERDQLAPHLLRLRLTVEEVEVA